MTGRQRPIMQNPDMGGDVDSVMKKSVAGLYMLYYEGIISTQVLLNH